jgi:hypothetical protein
MSDSKDIIREVIDSMGQKVRLVTQARSSDGGGELIATGTIMGFVASERSEVILDGYSSGGHGLLAGEGSSDSVHISIDSIIDITTI